MEQLFFHQLTQLGYEKLNLLYQDKASVICIFRTLPDVAQDLIYRLLGIGDCQIAQNMIVKWTEGSQNARQKMDSSFKMLKRAKILIAREDNPKAFTLNQYFQNSLQSVLSCTSGPVLKFRLSKPRSLDMMGIQRESERKWKNILNAMLGIISPRDLPEKTLNLLIKSALLKMQKGSRGNLEITPQGFKFVMRKPEEQVSTLVMKYIELSYQFDRDIVEIYQTIFALTLTRYEDLYKTDIRDSQRILDDFNDLGLITIISKANSTVFKISHLLSQFLGGKRSTDLKEEVKGRVDRNERFLIVQTNFKVFAYTESRLFLAILSLFVNIQIKLPHLVIGSLTHKSVRNAFLKGIKAKDISSFLDARSLIMQGIAIDGPSKIAFLESKENKRNVPTAVVQQLSLWQDDLERFKMKPGILISDFKDEANYRKCLENFNSRNLLEYSSDASKIIILKPHAEGYAHDFIMKL